MKKSRLLGAVCTCVVGLLTASANAATITLQTTISNSAGNYDIDGTHNDTDSRVGQYSDGTNWHDLRNYFLFDISQLAGQTVTDATLRIYNPYNGIFFVHPTEQFELYDVTTDYFDVRYSNGSTAIWNDLGTGNQYGSIILSEANEASWVEITLNANALYAINNPTSTIYSGSVKDAFGLGGKLAGTSSGTAFKGLYSSPKVELVAAVVPLPAVVWLFCSGLLGLVGIAGRK